MSRTRILTGLSAALLSLHAQADHLEELVVTASHDTRTIDLASEPVISPDVSQLLKRAPGANVNSNGPISGIPQYRGMFGPRIAASLDGNQLAPACSNWMDPPLSYAAGGQLESVELYRGIAPVSVAQESLGGAIEAHTAHGPFGPGADFTLSGSVNGSVQSANSGIGFDGALRAANDSHRISLAATTESGDNARFADGKIRPTEYQRQRYDLGYGLRAGDHELALHYGYNDTGESGTPALPMDIDDSEGNIFDLGYHYDPGADLRVNVTLYGSELDHRMTNYHLRQAPVDRSRWRGNTADTSTRGFTLQGERSDARGEWQLGVDGFSSSYQSEIDNPNNPAFFVIAFNDASRDILGLFVQRRQELLAALRGEFGVRYNRVTTDAGEVDGTPAQLMPPAQMLRDAFNSARRKQRDDNVDLVARLWYKASAQTSWYLGMARKTRSPGHQERYLWLPLEATAGLADGNLYIGNIDLKPEVSREIELGLDYSGDRLTLAPRLFYKDVDDYIQGTPSSNQAAIMLVRGMNAANGTANPAPLQFNNVAAKLYGFDMDWAWQLGAGWELSGLVNYVRGERKDIDDNLYRIAPPNASVRLGYARADWSAGIEGVAYARQNRVSETNREQKSDGYGLLNLSAQWRATPRLTLAGGVDNLLDREYRDHLAGYNRAANPDIAPGERLPGYGANFYARATYTF